MRVPQVLIDQIQFYQHFTLAAGLFELTSTTAVEASIT
jgi:hypothetical protein